MRPIVALIVVCMIGGAAGAQSSFFATSPGALSKDHGALDSVAHCNDCHINGTPALSDTECLDCHDHQKLRDRIAAKQGFHASAAVAGKPCKTCHVEHRGATYDIMGWKSVKNGMTGFDHDLPTINWPRKGGHVKPACTACHTKTDQEGNSVFMGVSRTCAGCHTKDQPHKMTRAELLDCARCHTESVWRPQKGTPQFNHDDRKDAAMPLFGSHKQVACSKCHRNNVFKLPFPDPISCGNAGCHTSPHDGHLFSKPRCELCHSPTAVAFKPVVFDHATNAHFALANAHAAIKCYDCHTKARGETKPSPACEVCHAKDSHHKDRFKAFGDPPRCATCHTSGGPKFTPTAFDHGRTKFKLGFKHAQVQCRSCHTGSGPADFLNFNGDTACKDCHVHKKVHASKQFPDGEFASNQCLQAGCHLHSGDRRVGPKGGGGSEDKNTKYDDAHGVLNGDFKLVKGHKDVACTKCHKGASTSFSSMSMECGDNSCHADSLHHGSLDLPSGERVCTQCHRQGDFTALEFRHDMNPFPNKEPSFLLKGMHVDVKCEGCHPKRQFNGTPRTCGDEACHKKDDAHKGRLGDHCEKCHVETGDEIFNHNTMSAFHLDGKHLEVRCADCHPSKTFKPRPTDCFGCHPEPKVHKGQYGTACAQCHTTRTWNDVKPLHDVGDFSLKGMHDNIACERCHRDSRPLAGSGNLCVNCHRQDDIHGNSLSPRCGECHTQWSFAPARFDHTRVGCNLTGLHRTIACFDCHKNGNFAAISAECVSCHHDDALRAGTYGTTHPTVTTCANCHNTTFWNPTALKGTGRESVCR